MHSWKSYKLEDVLDALIDYRGKTPKKRTFGIPLVTAKIVKQGRILEANEFIAFDDYNSWMTRGFPAEGDVVLTTEAPLGEVAQIKDPNIALAQRIVTLRGKKDVLHNGYLKYFLQSNEGQNRLIARESGTTVTGIKQSELRKVLIDCPSFPEQTSIASILSALDDKIELNLQMNKTLEEMAMALYKHWFVDFGPFQNGKFVESELGMIPEGWEVKNLEYLLDIKYGKDHKELKEGLIPVYGTGGIMRYVDRSLYEQESILIPRKGSLKNLYYLNTPFWTVDTLFYSRIKHNGFGKYTFHFLKTLELESMDVGSAIPSLTTQLLNRIKVVIPQNTEVLKYDESATIWFNIIQSNIEENRTLTTLRDTLLPKLISGQIRVKDAEQMLAASL